MSWIPFAGRTTTASPCWRSSTSRASARDNGAISSSSIARNTSDAAARIRQGHINARIIKDWQAQALLACTVPDLPGTAAQVLVGAGVQGVDDLADAEVDTLLDAIALFAGSNEGERALRGGSPPDRGRVMY